MFIAAIPSLLHHVILVKLLSPSYQLQVYMELFQLPLKYEGNTYITRTKIEIQFFYLYTQIS
jgi:hypothetical protein